METEQAAEMSAPTPGTEAAPALCSHKPTPSIFIQPL